ncbi:MAG TPA: endolytic transglycosylase MltG [Candidatus Dormibacteraeota bacterium]|nr:endolytic transglycosylase MltG [Candidatus Dormibacteraeota bacterium]
MTRQPDPQWGAGERRNARIRQLRDQREGPMRRRQTFQPLVLIGWFAGVIALVAVLIFIGFQAFAPGLMSWVEEHPGSVEHGLVRDFVEWYRPGTLDDDPASADGPRVTVTVAPGSTDSEIGQLLFEEGLVSSRMAFHYAVLQAGREGTLAAGTYDLSPSLRPSQIVAALRQEQGEVVEVTLREGWRVEEIVGYLGTTTLTMNLEEFASLATNPPVDLLRNYDFLADLPVGRSLEGYLYPDTYQFDANDSAREVIERLLNEFGTKVTPEIREGIAAQGLSIDEAVTLASIVEREAVLDAERPLIAGVFLNRIRNPGAGTVGLLQADPTLQYALATAEFGGRAVDDWGTIEWWPPLPAAGNDVELPEELAGYQTYRVQGLPPTPIAAPRIASIAGVAAPDTAGGYYYFVAGCPNGTRDGSHYFARNLGEHNANIAKANDECPA